MRRAANSRTGMRRPGVGRAGVQRLATCGAALVVATAWLVLTAPSGLAAGALTTAWWWQGEPSTGAVPAPPTVPDGGLWVSSNTAGPQALSALRVPLEPGDSAPVLTLAVHQAVPAGGLALAAYPTTAAWTAGPGQAWASRPAYNPTGLAAAGMVSADGKQVTFDLSGLVAGDALDVVIAPTPAASPPPAPLPAPPQPAPPTFDVTFEKPGASTFRVAPTPVSNESPPPPAPIVAPSVGQPLPSDSLAPFLPSGLEAPPPLSAVPGSTAVASPPVVLQNVPRNLVPAVSARRSFADSAAIAVMLGIVLLWLAREGGPRPSGLRRPRLTLYDLPNTSDTGAVVRTGTAPPLR